jgi:MFS family permease
MCAIGAVMMALSMFLASFGTHYWHFLMTQGVLFGISCGLSYFPALTIISHWFDKRKGFATGIAVSGSGVGGLIVAPLTRFLIEKVGVRNALRILGGYSGIAVFAASFLLKTTRPNSKRGSMQYLKVASDLRFIKLFIMAVVAALGYFVPFFFIPVFATHYGMSTYDGALVVGLLNGASGIGRIVLGFNADIMGHLNTLWFCLATASLTVLIIWPFATTLPLLIFFGISYGFFVGGFYSLLPTAIIQIFGLENISSITGMVYTGFSLNVIGASIGGAILDIFTSINADGTETVNFIPSIMFSGIALFISSLFILSVKYSAAKGKLITKI